MDADPPVSGTRPPATILRHRVRYRETDQQGVVFNGHWLAWFDDAFTELLKELGVEVVGGDDPFEPMLVHAEIDWSGPATFDDLVEIVVHPTRIGASSFDLRFDATVGEREVCSATITYVSVDARTHGSCPIPDHVRAQLEARRHGGAAG